MAEVVDMLVDNKGQVPTPHELQKVVREFADVMQKLIVLMKNSGIEGSQLPDAVRPSDVARIAKEESSDKSGPKPKL
jgi:hypothetical protein